MTTVFSPPLAISRISTGVSTRRSRPGNPDLERERPFG
jgi:hypothetical protein